MLSLRQIPRSITQLLKSSIHTSLRVLASKDLPPSSSDSSDSDSDKESTKLKEEKVIKQNEFNSDLSDTNKRLNALLEKINEKSLKSQAIKKSQTILDAKSNSTINMDVSIKSRKERFKKVAKEKIKQKPLEEQLVIAAKDVAQKIGGDTHKTELELLSLVLKKKEELTIKEQSSTVKEATINLSDLLSGMQVEKTIPFMKENQNRQQMFEKLKDRLKQPSVAESLLHAKSKGKSRMKAMPDSAELKALYSDLGILKQLPKEIKDTPKLSIWDAMEVREMKLATMSVPQNVFQELILWTEQGKLWNFPINNEQGMEEEENVHFSEHVFMERHLKEWCPRKGPIRHFMELVCNGLSKNPYMTVAEKIGHISWYKNYFEDKKELLQDLGLLENMNAKKQIKA